MSYATIQATKNTSVWEHWGGSQFISGAGAIGDCDFCPFYLLIVQEFVCPPRCNSLSLFTGTEHTGVCRRTCTISGTLKRTFARRHHMAFSQGCPLGTRCCLFFSPSLRTAWGYWCQDAVDRRQLTLDRRRLALGSTDADRPVTYSKKICQPCPSPHPGCQPFLIDAFHCIWLALCRAPSVPEAGGFCSSGQSCSQPVSGGMPFTCNAGNAWCSSSCQRQQSGQRFPDSAPSAHRRPKSTCVGGLGSAGASLTPICIVPPSHSSAESCAFEWVQSCTSWGGCIKQGKFTKGSTPTFA